MSAFIRLNKQDAFIESYVAHKSWAIYSASFGDSGIEVLVAETGSTETIFNSGSSPRTGTNSSQYRELLHSSLQHLYYSGVFTSTLPTSSYEDYPQTTLYTSSLRSLSDKALVVSIPQDIFGNAIKPNTFAMGSNASIQLYVSGGYINSGYFTTSSGITYNVFDNGEGALLESGSLLRVGDIIYAHGLAILTTSASIAAIETSLSSSNFNLSYQSTKDIFTHNYKCRIRESDLNFSQNPTIHSGSTSTTISGSKFYQHSGVPYDFATGSYFQPYVTAVGLYNDSNELIAVGKLAQPVPSSRYVDTTFVIKFDV
jgi:hypothetical protein